MIGGRLRATYDDLCSLKNPCVADIARTWSWRMVWPVARQLVALGLMVSDNPTFPMQARLEMLPWRELDTPDLPDIPYGSTGSILTESRKPLPEARSTPRKRDWWKEAAADPKKRWQDAWQI